MPGFNRRSALLSVGLGLLLVAASADAERPWRLPRPVPSYSVTLEDEYGSPLPSFRVEGRTFVLGERGERYAVRVHNPTAERVEAVVSIDGRDSVSGRVGDYRTQRGYVIPPYGSVRVDGFRRSLDAVAAFRFSSPRDSYSAQRGTPENVGVIGVAVFRERSRVAAREAPIARDEPRPFPRRAESESRSEPDSRSKGSAERGARDGARPPSAAPAKRSQSSRSGDSARDDVNNLGTEYGETRDSSVVEVSFQRRTNAPDRLFTLRYDDAEGLERRGVILEGYARRAPRREPEPFPERRFAPPPR